MIEVQVFLDFRELHKIINGLLVLRQKQVKLQHTIIIDPTNMANKNLVNEISRLDRLISKLEKLLETIDGDQLNIPPDDNDES